MTGTISRLNSAGVKILGLKKVASGKEPVDDFQIVGIKFGKLQKSFKKKNGFFSSLID